MWSLPLQLPFIHFAHLLLFLSISFFCYCHISFTINLFISYIRIDISSFYNLFVWLFYLLICLINNKDCQKRKCHLHFDCVCFGSILSFHILLKLSCWFFAIISADIYILLFLLLWSSFLFLLLSSFCYCWSNYCSSLPAGILSLNNKNYHGAWDE